MVVRLSKQFFFEAAHALPNVPPTHKCHRMHGHSYRLEVSVEGSVDPAKGWLYDHAVLSDAVDPIVEALDHRCLNDLPGLENPTVENLAAWLWARLQPVCPGLVEIVIQETPNAWCTYRGQ
jgi:6-pyruvoyltetrahydropterin/6-carboxytetrahydropterin synthase